MEATDRSERLLFGRGGNFAEQDGITRGDITKRHTDRKLGAQFAVEAIFRRELRRGDGGEHRAVAVENVAEINRIRVLLFGQITSSAREGLEVTDRVLELLDTDVFGARLHTEVGQARARLDFELGCFGERHANGVSETVK